MITFVRQEDGTYNRTGELTTARKVQIQIEDERPFGDYTLVQALEFFEEAIKKNQMRKTRYRIVPMNGTSMPEPQTLSVEEATTVPETHATETVPEPAQIVTPTKRGRGRPRKHEFIERKQMLITCSYDGCNETYPRSKGRYPQRFCQKHRGEKN